MIEEDSNSLSLDVLVSDKAAARQPEQRSRCRVSSGRRSTLGSPPFHGTSTRVSSSVACPRSNEGEAGVGLDFEMTKQTFLMSNVRVLRL